MTDFQNLTKKELQQGIEETSVAIEKAGRRLEEFAASYPDRLVFQQLAGIYVGRSKKKLEIERVALLDELDKRESQQV